MGRVELVFDHERGQEVARKRVATTSLDGARRFKREFRAVEQLLHPNLVRLYELGEDDDGLYFTMDHIAGRPLAEHCRPGDRFDDDALARLVHALPQLVEGSAYLHANGIVHRDIKPDNILVAASGRVTILDFGVLAELDASHTEIAGTVGFIAPEHLRGEAPSPASDVYALGATLYLIVAGRPVFAGSADQVRRAHLTDTPAPLSGVPAVLARGVTAMLSKNPGDRPTLPDIAQELLPAIGGRRVTLPAPAPPTVRLWGRQAIQDRLRVSLATGNDAMIVLSGGTGVGKTALLDWVLDRARRSGALVLRGQARASERVAFNAVDPIVDQLARALAMKHQLSEDEHRHVLLAATLFPDLRALLGVDAERERSRRELRARLFGVRDIPPLAQSRASAFSALAALIRSTASKQSQAVIAIDDLQWADDDSLAAVERLIEEPPRNQVVLATLRDDMTGTAATSWLRGQAHVRVIDVPTLSAADLEEIVRSAAARDGESPSDATVSNAVTTAAGNPFIAELLGRSLAAQPTGDEPSPLLRMVRRAPARQQRILGALFAADGWEQMSALAEQLGGVPGELDDDLTELASVGLIRRSGFRGGAGAATLYHDAVAAAIASVVDPELVRQAHAAYAARSELSDARRARHLLESGQAGRAAEFARRAADRAMRRGAYSLAAGMAAVAAQHGDTDVDAMMQLAAVARERSGHFEQAASDWRRVANRLTGESRRNALFHEAHCLFAVGRLTVAWQRIDELFGDAGYPGTRAHTGQKIATLARLLAGPRRRHRTASDSASLRSDLELATFLSFVDPMVGIRSLQQVLRRAAKRGAAEAIAYCYYSFAYFAEFTSGVRSGPAPLAVRYRRAADALVARGASELLFLDVFPYVLDAIATLRSGDYDAALARLGTGEQRGVDRGGLTPIETGLVSYMKVLILSSAQRLPELTAVVRSYDMRIIRGGTTGVLPHHLMSALAAPLLTGRWNDARALLALGGQRGAGARTTHQTARAVYLAYLESLDGDPRRARESLARALPSATRLLIGRSMLVACSWASIAALVEINALRVGDPRASLVRARRFLSRVSKAPPILAGSVERYSAYAAEVDGRPEDALALLARAERIAGGKGRRLDESIARYQRGLRVGGDEGAGLCRSARERVHDLGARACVLDEDARFR